MKKMSWKYIVAACSACLLLFTASANAAILNFDSLPNDPEGAAVPNGYGGLQWDNFYAVDGLNNIYNPSGYKAGLVSKRNDIFNGGADTGSIFVNQGFFILLSMDLTGAWNDKLQVEITGFFHEKQVYDYVFTVSAVKPTMIRLPKAVLVDDVEFNSFGGTPYAPYSEAGSGAHFAMDNLSVIVVK